MKRIAGAAAVLLMLASSLQAQAPARDTTAGWNTPDALALIQRAAVRRDQPRGDSALRNYSAKATGHVYFYLDRQEDKERTLVKVDQIALELYWAAPDLTKQKIVGLRDVSRLPNRQRYHLDHLTVVQNGFGDIIRMGDGDEVRDVPHPAAPGSDTIYEFRLADSLELNFAGQQPVQVLEVQVRPRQYNRSALIGSLFIDKASGDIVRMTFTFTPASYVDRRLDYINVSLDNGLWSGRYWLPNEQYVELRRQIPELDFVAGTVIQGRLRVSDYQFNQTLPPNFFYGPGIEAAPPAERQAFAFTEDLYAGLDREGLAPPPQVADLRAEAIQLLRQRKLSGLPPWRVYIPNSSSILRFNRAEGLYLGAGVSYQPAGGLRYDGTAGWAFSAGHASATLGMRYQKEGRAPASGRGFYNELRDVGVRPGMPGALNTLTSMFDARDYLDPYYASGGQIKVVRQIGLDWEADLRIGLEHNSSAARDRFTALFGDQAFRPVRPIDEGTFGMGLASISGPLFTRERVTLETQAALEVGAWESGTYLRPVARAELTYESASRAVTGLLRGSGGWASAEAPAQKLFLLGGRGTLPGYPYRNLTGSTFWLAEAEVTRSLWTPWVRLRGMAAHGGVTRPDLLPAGWPASATSGTSIGIGLGLIYDVIRLDLVKGGANSPRLLFSVKPDFWDLL